MIETTMISKRILSSLSSIPPCPGIILLLSFTPQYLLNFDSINHQFEILMKEKKKGIILMKLSTLA